MVVGGRGDRPSELEALQGKTAEEVVHRMGKPTYVVPAGNKVTLRYSAPRHPTNSYEVFLVVLNGNGAVCGTQHFVYRD